MTWKPESASNLMTAVDFEGRIAAADQGATGTFGKLKHNLQSSSGAEPFEWPEMAPLVFPTLDDIAVTPGKNRDNVIKRGGKFVQDYMDRRAQAEWAGQNPNSKMANEAPKPEFHSRYADPNSPASSGDILALLTGGYLRMPLRASRRSLRKHIGDLRGRGDESAYGREKRLGPLSLLSGVRKVLQKVTPLTCMR